MYGRRRREEVHAGCAPDIAAVGRDIDAAAGAVRKDGVTELAVERKVVYARNGTSATGTPAPVVMLMLPLVLVAWIASAGVPPLVPKA